MNFKSILFVTVFLLLIFNLNNNIYSKNTDFKNIGKGIKIDNSEIDPNSYTPFSFNKIINKVYPSIVEVIFKIKKNKDNTLTSRRGSKIDLDRLLELNRYVNKNLGLVISSDGYILTNDNSSRNTEDIIKVKTSDNKEYTAKIVLEDKLSDILILKIDNKNLSSVFFGDCKNVKKGDVVLNVGKNIESKLIYTLNIINDSQLSDNLINLNRNFLETGTNVKALSNILVDIKGRVVGFKSNYYNKGNTLSGLLSSPTFTTKVLSSNTIIEVINRLVKGNGEVQRGYLGISLADLNDDDKTKMEEWKFKNKNAIKIVAVEKGTPAYKAGVKSDDIIISHNKKEVTTILEFQVDIGSLEPGKKVNLDIVRNGDKKTIEVILGRRNSLVNTKTLDREGKFILEIVKGVEVKNISDEIRKNFDIDKSIKGLFVSKVKDNTRASLAGITPGSIITEIDQKKVSSIEEGSNIVKDFDGDTLIIQLYKSGSRDVVAIPID